MSLVGQFRQFVCTIKRDAADAAYQSFKSGDYSDVSGARDLEEIALKNLQKANRDLAELKMSMARSSNPVPTLRA